MSCKVIFFLDYKRALYIQEEMSCYRVEGTLTKVIPQKTISKLSFAPDSDPKLDPPDIDESSRFGMGMRARDKAKGGGVKFRVRN